MILVAALVATVGFSAGASRSVPWSIPWPPPAASTGVDVNQLLRTNSEIFGDALQIEKKRADAAVVELATTNGALKTCERDLKARNDYISGPVTEELRKLRAELSEATEALTRVEAYFGAAAMLEAQQHRGWLRRALAMGADGYQGKRYLVASAN